MTDKNKCQCSCDECGAECEPFYKTNKTIIDGIDVIKCKYKIQSSENFKTKPYCSILNKFCEDISFVCDKNCQIFEDFKQLARAKEEIEKLKSQLQTLDEETVTVQLTQVEYDRLKAKEQECENQKERLEYYCNKTNQLLNDIDNLDRFNTELQEENEELKNATITLGEGLNFQQERADKLEQECDRLKEKQKELLHDCNSCKFHQYKQALIEIENYVRDNCDFDKSDKLISNTGAYDILKMIPYDIKAKDGE